MDFSSVESWGNNPHSRGSSSLRVPSQNFEARVVNQSAEGEIMGSDLLVARSITELDEAVHALQKVIADRYEVDDLQIDIRVPEPPRRARVKFDPSRRDGCFDSN